MPPRSPSGDAPLRRNRAAWLIVAGLTLGTMAVWRVESEELRRWAETHGYGGAGRAWIRPVPVPDRPWSAWPRWVEDWSGPILRQVGFAQAGLLFVGLGMTIMGLPRWRRRTSTAARRRVRRGPGEVAAAISAAWLAIATMTTVDSTLVLPQLPTWTPDPWELAVTVPRWFLTGCTSWGTAGLPESIAVAWAYLAITRRFRWTSTDPIERVGRWLGWGWIGSGALVKLVDVVGIRAA